MFQNPEYKDLQWLDNDLQKGSIHVNTDFDFKKPTIRPFDRTKKGTVLSIGRVNYGLLDNFIITSLNDYYQKGMLTKDEYKRNAFIKEYNELYILWYTINQAKNTQNPNLNSYYDDLAYRLYLLGYKE